jgi:hypothetical protein
MEKATRETTPVAKAVIDISRLAMSSSFSVEPIIAAAIRAQAHCQRLTVDPGCMKISGMQLYVNAR